MKNTGIQIRKARADRFHVFYKIKGSSIKLHTAKTKKAAKAWLRKLKKV